MLTISRVFIYCRSKLSRHTMAGITTKHLTTGDAFPELPADNKLVLLTMRFCPYAQRAHLVLDAKNIDYHVVRVQLKEKPGWLTQYSKLGKVPALGLTNEPDSPYLSESLLIADYLDEKYRDVRPLHPADPLFKVQDRLWVERFGPVLSAFYRLVYTSKPDPKAADDIAAVLDAFEVELKRRDQRFFGGVVRPGMLDFMIWPWIERLEALRYFQDFFFDFSAKRWPGLVQYSQYMQQDEAVKKTYLPGEVHYKFLQSYLSGSTNYELLASL